LAGPGGGCSCVLGLAHRAQLVGLAHRPLTGTT
jgi:hypothetical protein